MKLIHISDIHLGKKVNEYPMAEEQEYILKQILGIIEEEKPDGVLIAGDIYDRSQPPVEAVQLLDDFLVCLAKMNQQVFVISGNHDSPERIAFGSRIMDAGGIHLSPVYNGHVDPFVLHDEYGDVYVYMLPFIKPTGVRAFFPDDEIASYTDAVRHAVEKMNADTSDRNVLITHQFVTGATRSDSEDKSVGGTDNVDASVFEPFDYVALGHIHSPQNCGAPNIRYCGTPLKYSLSEANDTKSVTVVELFEKGKVSYRTRALIPLHDLRGIRGTYDELMTRSYYESSTLTEDFVYITLTDEDEIPDVMAKMRTVYHRIMAIQYDNTRTQTDATVFGASDVDTKSPLTLFGEFYELQNNRPMNNEQEEYIRSIIEKITEESL